MTKEEAKEKLYLEWQKLLEDNIDYAGISEAYKMAFKALEQEPCEDAVSRQAVLDCLTATGLKKYDFILNARDKIKNLPSVKPQELILDKIRAEIEENAYPIVHGVNNHEKGMTLYGILQIIDKYRGESDCRECKAEYECYYCKKYEESEDKE